MVGESEARQVFESRLAREKEKQDKAAADRKEYAKRNNDETKDQIKR